MRIIPAIDIIDGKCVRLSQGNYSTKKIYSENPLEVAKRFEDNGIQFLHLVDLDGAKFKRIVNYKILEQIAAKTSLQIDFGGGIQSEEDLEIAFQCGANQVTGGSVAVKNPILFESWLQKYGSDKIILGADVKDEKIAINAWLEDSDLEIWPFIKKYMDKKLQYVVCTDISKDGMLQGPSTVLYKKLLRKAEGLKLIASGGISTMENLHTLSKIGCEGAIIGKAIYEAKISLKELQEFISDNNPEKF